MKLSFTVHSANQEDFAVVADVGGKSTEVKVAGLVVELVMDGGSMSPTIRMIPDDMSAALAEYVVGATVEMTLKVVAQK